jgi:intraflagellar transport protein 122
MAALSVKAKPFVDSEELQPMCYRCSSYNPLLANHGNRCINCFQPWCHSYVSFGNNATSADLTIHAFYEL